MRAALQYVAAKIKGPSDNNILIMKNSYINYK